MNTANGDCDGTDCLRIKVRSRPRPTTEFTLHRYENSMILKVIRIGEGKIFVKNKSNVACRMSDTE